MQTQTVEPILAQHPFVKDLDPRHLGIIVGCASNVRFDAGTYIFREGQEANQFYIIRHGKVALELFAAERGVLTIQTLGVGEVLGWSWLFAPYQWLFDARALELTRAIALDGKCLRGKCDEDHSLGYEMVKRFAQVIIERLQAARLQLLDVYGVRS